MPFDVLICLEGLSRRTHLSLLGILTGFDLVYHNTSHNCCDWRADLPDRTVPRGGCEGCARWADSSQVVR